MELHTLIKTTAKRKRRLGQGHGSGRVKTAGRGTKGQKARGKIPIFFEGGALPLMKRLPFLRGKGKNRSYQKKMVVLSLDVLNRFPKNSVVDAQFLIDQNIVTKSQVKANGVKILGKGIIEVPLTVKVPVSNSAKEKIIKAQGSVEV